MRIKNQNETLSVRRLTFSTKLFLFTSLALFSVAAFAAVPTASNVSINNATPVLGDELTGLYTYDDADGDAEGTSTYRWLRNGAAISGATATLEKAVCRRAWESKGEIRTRRCTPSSALR